MRDPSNRTRMLVRWTRESGESPGHGKNLLSRQEQEKDRIWKVAVFLKDCFHARQILRAMKIGHWKSCHGSERRLKQCVCARRILRTWMDKSEDLQTTEMREPCAWCTWDISAFKLSGICAAGIPDTKAMVITIIVFLLPAYEAKIGLFTDSAKKSNLWDNLCVGKPVFGTSQNGKLDFWWYLWKSPRNEAVSPCICWTIFGEAVKAPTNSKICMKTSPIRRKSERNVGEKQRSI